MKYDVTVTTLAPLHIGTGTEFIKDYDFVVRDKRTWILNQDAILAAEYEEEMAGTGTVNWERLRRPAGELVAEDLLEEGSPFVRYPLEGVPVGERIREQIKDAFGRLYLPGSSLKGALRTALMAFAVAQGERLDTGDLNDKREEAAQSWEWAIFGRDPNHDLLRAVQVADSTALLPAGTLILANAEVVGQTSRQGNATRRGAPVNVEAIKPDVPFRTTIVIDDYLIVQQAARLGFKRPREFLNLTTAARVWAEAVLQREVAFARERPKLRPALALYSDMLRVRLPANAFFLQFGWGAGWHAKTVGPWLPQAVQWQVRKRYRLGRPPAARADWQPEQDAPFPKSRRSTATYGPFGWCWCR